MLATGLAVVGAQFIQVDAPPLGWRSCTCLDWNEQARRCEESIEVVTLPCGVPVSIRAFLEPADRLWPQREIETLTLAAFHVGDLNLDGAVGRADWVFWLMARYDYDGDGRLTVADDQGVLTAITMGCP